MICPHCAQEYDQLPCRCGWAPKASPAALKPQASYAYLLTPAEQAYGQFRLDLLHQGRAHHSVLQVTADGLEAWLDDPAHEAWAVTQPMTRCTHRLDTHSLLTCLLEEIARYRQTLNMAKSERSEVEGHDHPSM